MVYIFVKQRRTIKVEDAKLWVGGEITEGMEITVRHTRFIVSKISAHGTIKIITLTDIK